MPDIQKAVEGLQSGADVLFLLVGAILVFAMHGGFAFLEAGTVRHKNQVNALCKILVDFAISTLAYFFIGYTIAYGVAFFVSAEALNGAGKGFDPQGLTLVKFFFLATFAAAVPAIVSGGIAERARFSSQCAATALIVGLVYPLFEGIVWNKNYGLQENFFKAMLGEEFHDFAGSIVVHAVGGWIGFSAVRRLGPAARPLRQRPRRRHSALVDPVAGHGLLAAVHRLVRLQRDERAVAEGRHRPDRDQLADGHVRRHPRRADRGRRRSRASSTTARSPGLVAVCAGSDVMHPIGSLFVGGVAGVIFVYVLPAGQRRQVELRRRAGRVAPARLVRSVGRHRLRHLRPQGLRRAGRRELLLAARRQPDGRGLRRHCRLHHLRASSTRCWGLRLSAEDERRGADLAVHKIGANPEEDVRMGRV